MTKMPKIIAFLLLSVSTASAQKIDFNSGWEIKGPGSGVQSYLGRNALRLSTGNAYRRDVRLKDGTIELDVATTGGRSFFYVQFRMESDGGLRRDLSSAPQDRTRRRAPVQPGLPGREQLAALPWRRRHGARGHPAKRMAAREDHPRRTACRDLRRRREGAAALGTEARAAGRGRLHCASELRPAGWSGGGDELRERGDPRGRQRLRFSRHGRGARGPLRNRPKMARLRALRHSGRSGARAPAQLPAGKSSRPSPPVFSSSCATSAGPSAESARPCWRRRSSNPARKRESRFISAISDEVTVFLNGAPLFAADDSYSFDRPRREGLIGLDQATVYLPLRAGKNELVLAVTDVFGGWGLMGQLERQR